MSGGADTSPRDLEQNVTDVIEREQHVGTATGRLDAPRNGIARRTRLLAMVAVCLASTSTTFTSPRQGHAQPSGTKHDHHNAAVQDRLEFVNRVLTELQLAKQSGVYPKGMFDRFDEATRISMILQSRRVPEAKALSTKLRAARAEIEEARAASRLFTQRGLHERGGPSTDLKLDATRVTARAESILAQGRSALGKRRISRDEVLALQKVALLKRYPDAQKLLTQAQALQSLANAIHGDPGAQTRFEHLDAKVQRALRNAEKAKTKDELKQSAKELTTILGLAAMERQVSGRAPSTLGKLRYQQSRIAAALEGGQAALVHQFTRPDGTFDPRLMMQRQLSQANPNLLPENLRGNPLLRAQMEAMARHGRQMQHADAFEGARRLSTEAACLQRQGQYEAAEAKSRQAIAIYVGKVGPKSVEALEARLGLAEVLNAAGKRKRALVTLSELFSNVDPNAGAGLTGSLLSRAYLIQSDVLFELGDVNGSRTALNDASKHRRLEDSINGMIRRSAPGLAATANSLQSVGYEERELRLLSNEQKFQHLVAAKALRADELGLLARQWVIRGDKRKAATALLESALASERTVDAITPVGTLAFLPATVVLLQAAQEATALTLAHDTARTDDILLAYWMTASRKDRAFGIMGQSATEPHRDQSARLATARHARAKRAAEFLTALTDVPSDQSAASVDCTSLSKPTRHSRTSQSQTRGSNGLNPVSELETRLFGARGSKSLALSGAMPFTRLPRQSPGTGPQQAFTSAVQAALASDETLIEFVLYNPVTFDDSELKDLGKLVLPSPRFAAPRYAAFVVTRTAKAPLLVDVGAASRIDGVVSALRRQLGTPSSDLASVERAAREAYDAIWKPLTGKIPSAGKVIVTLDGELHRLPIGTLHDGTNWLIDRYRVAYANTSRDLVTRPSEQPSSQTVGSIFAFPDAPGKRYEHPALQPSNFKPLPGTKQEADAIQRRLPTTRRNLGASANEQRLFATTAPRFLHISTHGLVLVQPDDEMAIPGRGVKLVPGGSTPPSGGESKRSDPEEHWLRTALVLSPPGADQAAEPWDSFATAYEIARMDLRGTKVVVLAACETGLGITDAQHGVQSLRRAFTMAGAHSVVASLWLVSDASTVTLMDRFYANMVAGKSRLDALHEAKLTQKRVTPHPFHWGPFTYAGKDGPL